MLSPDLTVTMSKLIGSMKRGEKSKIEIKKSFIPEEDSELCKISRPIALILLYEGLFFHFKNALVRLELSNRMKKVFLRGRYPFQFIFMQWRRKLVNVKWYVEGEDI